MVVIVVTACPEGLRGHLTRWLLEISAGVFVGNVTARVRDLMWERVIELARDGSAILVHSARGEQRLAFKVYRHDWVPLDLDGVQLMLRPADDNRRAPQQLRAGWSNAGKYRRAERAKRDGTK